MVLKIADLAKEIDRDGDGHVSADEQKVLDTLKGMDVDGDGTIEIGELLNLGAQMNKQEAANKNLKKLIWGIMLMAVVFCVLTFAICYAAVEAGKDSKPDESGIVKTVAKDGLTGGAVAAQGAVRSESDLFDVLDMTSTQLNEIKSLSLSDTDKVLMYSIVGQTQYANKVELYTGRGDVITISATSAFVTTPANVVIWTEDKANRRRSLLQDGAVSGSTITADAAQYTEQMWQEDEEARMERNAIRQDEYKVKEEELQASVTEAWTNYEEAWATFDSMSNATHMMMMEQGPQMEQDAMMKREMLAHLETTRNNKEMLEHGAMEENHKLDRYMDDLWNVAGHIMENCDGCVDVPARRRLMAGMTADGMPVMPHDAVGGRPDGAGHDGDGAGKTAAEWEEEMKDYVAKNSNSLACVEAEFVAQEMYLEAGLMPLRNASRAEREEGNDHMHEFVAMVMDPSSIEGDVHTFIDEWNQDFMASQSACGELPGRTHAERLKFGHLLYTKIDCRMLKLTEYEEKTRQEIWELNDEIMMVEAERDQAEKDIENFHAEIEMQHMENHRRWMEADGMWVTYEAKWNEQQMYVQTTPDYEPFDYSSKPAPYEPADEESYYPAYNSSDERTPKVNDWFSGEEYSTYDAWNDDYYYVKRSATYDGEEYSYTWRQKRVDYDDYFVVPRVWSFVNQTTNMTQNMTYMSQEARNPVVDFDNYDFYTPSPTFMPGMWTPSPSGSSTPSPSSTNGEFTPTPSFNGTFNGTMEYDYEWDGMGCTATAHCDETSYCDEYHSCYSCASCFYYNDAIDLVEGAEDGSWAPIPCPDRCNTIRDYADYNNIAADYNNTVDDATATLDSVLGGGSRHRRH